MTGLALIPEVRAAELPDLRAGRGAGPTRARPGLMRPLVRVFLVLLGLAAALAAVAAARSVFAHGEWMYSDGLTLYHILRVRDGQPMYPPFDRPPFLMLMYWPLYLTVSGLLARLGGLDVAGTLYLARGITVLSALGASVAVAGLGVACGASRRAAGVGGALFATAYVVHPWAFAVRADLPAVALVLAGVWVFARRASPAATILAAVLLAGGFAAKQSYVAAVAALTIWCLWRREWRRGLILAAAWAVVVGAVFVTYQLATEGRFWQHTIDGNALPFRVQTVLNHLPIYLFLCLPIVALAACGLTDRGPTRPGHRSSRRLLTWYGAVAGAAGLVSLARAGANYNHLIEATALLAVFAGLGFDRCSRLAATRDADPTSGRPHPVAVAAMLAAVLILPIWLIRHHLVAMNPPDSRALTELVRSTPGLVLTQSDTFSVVMAEKDPVGGEPLGLALLAATGRWDPAPLNALIAEGAFEMVVLNSPTERMPTFDGFAWWPPHSLDLIEEHYQLTNRLDRHFIYTRAGASTSTAPDGAAR